MEKQRLDHELDLKKLELGGKFKSSNHFGASSTVDFEVTKHIRLVPPFQESDVDKYFLHFEKVAENLKWPKQYWTMLLQSVLIGKAREIYTQLSVVQSSDYDAVKQLILKGYELVPEAYRQKFRNCEKESNKTYVEFARKKEQLFDRWCFSQSIDKDYNKLRQLILIEEFKRCIHSDVRTFIDEQKGETLEDAARLADDYTLTHKVSFNVKPHQSFSSRRQDPSFSRSRPSVPPRNFGRDDSVNQNFDNSRRSSPRFMPSPPKYKPEVLKKPFNTLVCNYCKKEGHLLSDCFKLKRKHQDQNESRPTGLIMSPRSLLQFDDSHARGTFPKSKPILDGGHGVKVSSPFKPFMESFEPFIHDGFVSLTGDLSNATPIKILRDTGASQSLLLAETLPFSESSSTGTNVLIKGVDSPDYTPVPLHNVYLSSSLVSGPVTLGIRPSLPFEGVHLLLGNDLAGDKVVINPLVTENPCFDRTPDPIEEEVPGLYPSCAITRAMSKKKALEDDISSDVDLSDTFLSQVFQTDSSKSPVEFESLAGRLPNKSSSDQSEHISRSHLVTEQYKDPEISCLFQRAVDESEISNNPVCYFVQNGVLMRKWRPPDVPAEEEWAVKYQIVVPKP